MLDVVWVMVAAADDDQVFASPRDAELATGEKAEIAGAEPGRRVRIVGGEFGAEGRGGLFGLLPIAVRDGWAAEPNLADTVGRAGLGGLRVNDADFGALYVI